MMKFDSQLSEVSVEGTLGQASRVSLSCKVSLAVLLNKANSMVFSSFSFTSPHFVFQILDELPVSEINSEHFVDPVALKFSSY